MTKYVWLGGAIFVGLIVMVFAVFNSGGSRTTSNYVGSTIKAPGDDWWRVSFQNETDTGQFIHIAVNTKMRLFAPYKDEDKTALKAIGCSVGERTFL